MVALIFCLVGFIDDHQLEQIRWDHYSKMCYPNGMTKNQEAHLHGAWFAASFHILTEEVSAVAELSDDEGVALLKRLRHEALTVCRARAEGIQSHN
jgi:hypothetical protein